MATICWACDGATDEVMHTCLSAAANALLARAVDEGDNGRREIKVTPRESKGGVVAALARRHLVEVVPG